MISIEIEQKKVEEPTLERKGEFMGWPGRYHPHLCLVKSISYYFKVIPNKINRIHKDDKCHFPSPPESFKYAPGKRALGPFSLWFLKHLERLLISVRSI